MKGMSGRAQGLVLVVVLGLAGLAACQPQGTELSFQTLAQGEGFPTGRSYSGEEPDLLVITSPEQVDTPGGDVQFGSDLAEQLRVVDYSHNVVIVVLRGLMSALNPSYTVDILQVARSGNRVVVRTHFGAPGPEEGSFPAFSSPYHIIAVSKEGRWEQRIRFMLKVDERIVKEHTYFIP